MLFTKEEYKQRLKKVQKMMQEKGIELLISHDTNNLNYLTARFNDNSIYNLPYNEITTNNTSLVSSILLQQKLQKLS